jgi:hypothetical protein
MRPYSKTQIAFLCLLTIVLGLNIMPLYDLMKEIHAYKKITPYNIIGFKFQGLDQFTKGERIVGYYTDEDMETKQAQKSFAHAQYLLAPTILDFNNFSHRLVIFACKNEQNAWDRIKAINGTPLQRNQYGVMLVKTNRE